VLLVICAVLPVAVWHAGIVLPLRLGRPDGLVICRAGQDRISTRQRWSLGSVHLLETR
jgi:hypothetical protein